MSSVLNSAVSKFLLRILTLTSFSWGVWSSNHVIHSNLRPRLHWVAVINIIFLWVGGWRDQPDIGIAICIVLLGMRIRTANCLPVELSGGLGKLVNSELFSTIF